MLADELEAVRAGITAGQFANEASVSQGIVLRLLTALGWPTYDTRVVAPEFALENRRVDFALSHPVATPRVFIEVKQVGQSDGAERQLFEYAFHRGVPLAVLTDGQEWNFFLPGETGDYGERRVYKLDIVARTVAESVQRLERYLKYQSVCSGQALLDARADYQDVARARRAREVLPEAWSKLVAEEDELLLELLADRTESLCGYKPDPDTVAQFLRTELGRRPAGEPLVATPRRPEAPAPDGPPPTAGGSEFGFTFQAQHTQCRNGRDLLIKAIETLAARDPSFLDRFAALPQHGRRRRYVARDRTELYPGRPDLAEEHSHQLRSGYWIGINLSRSAIERILTMACDVAGVRYGIELQVRLG